MFPDTTYISLGISPHADAIVLQPIIRDSCLRPVWAQTISIAELGSFGRAAAISIIGRFALGAMTAYYAVISVYADTLILKNGKRLAVMPPDHSGSKRDLHLRIKAIVYKENSVVIERFNRDDAAGDDPRTLLLDTLMALGPGGSTDLVGSTLLDELVALHPDVFAPFPALLEKQSG